MAAATPPAAAATAAQGRCAGRPPAADRPRQPDLGAGAGDRGASAAAPRAQRVGRPGGVLRHRRAGRAGGAEQRLARSRPGLLALRPVHAADSPVGGIALRLCRPGAVAKARRVEPPRGHGPAAAHAGGCAGFRGGSHRPAPALQALVPVGVRRRGRRRAAGPGHAVAASHLDRRNRGRVCHRRAAARYRRARLGHLARRPLRASRPGGHGVPGGTRLALHPAHVPAGAGGPADALRAAGRRGPATGHSDDDAAGARA